MSTEAPRPKSPLELLGSFNPLSKALLTFGALLLFATWSWFLVRTVHQTDQPTTSIVPVAATEANHDEARTRVAVTTKEWGHYYDVYIFVDATSRLKVTAGPAGTVVETQDYDVEFYEEYLQSRQDWETAHPGWFVDVEEMVRSGSIVVSTPTGAVEVPILSGVHLTYLPAHEQT